MQIILQFSFPVTQHSYQKCVNRIQRLLRSPPHNCHLPRLQFLIIYGRKWVFSNRYSILPEEKLCKLYFLLFKISFFFHFPFPKDLYLKFYSNKAKLNTLSGKSFEQVKGNAFSIPPCGGWTGTDLK